MLHGMSNSERILQAFPLHERPRERLARCGAAAMADRELLAMVLRNGRLHVNAIDLASILITTFGSLPRIASAHVDELQQIDGMGPAKASALVSSFELGRRTLQAPLLPPLVSSEDIVDVARPLLTDLSHERVVLLVASASLRLERTIILTEGTKTASLLEPREVLHAVLRSNGVAFALAHNHPSGSAMPSAEDRRVTRLVASAASVVGLRFLDHVIVANSEWQSIPL